MAAKESIQDAATSARTNCHGRWTLPDKLATGAKTIEILILRLVHFTTMDKPDPEFGNNSGIWNRSVLLPCNRVGAVLGVALDLIEGSMRVAVCRH